ncbi:MAG: LOG family protein [Acidobacteriota bacterium]|jgi:hypothetical protein
MPDSRYGPTKAYKNLDFLNSRDGRTLRILSEYVEPQARFRRFRVEDTIVFFGSARIDAPDRARRRLEETRAALAAANRPSKRLQSEVDRARAAVRMSRYYDDSRELARLLTDWSKSLKGSRHRFLICSGGGPGIMEAANRGAAEARGRTVGLGISLPFEQTGNEYISRELSFEFHYFFMRKFWFVYLAKAVVIFPGGFGTLDEMMEILTLIQTRKSTKRIPMVVYGSRFWKKVLNLDALVEYGTISRADLDLFQFADSPEAAFEYLRDELTKAYLEP